MWNRQRVSVVIPAYNEEESIYKVVKDFSQPCIDEVIVVDNNSSDNTAKLAKKAGARVVKEPRQGYGYACQRALREAKGDIIILTESDCTFRGKDVYKLLNYIDEVDMVLGTRTTKELVSKKAKMNWLLYWGNIFLAKLIQLKFLGKIRLTDVGCTFRAIKKPALNKIKNKFTVGGTYFSPEMIILALRNGIRMVEVPVNYDIRIGQSKITANFKKSLIVGLKMLYLIIFK